MENQAYTGHPLPSPPDRIGTVRCAGYPPQIPSRHTGINSDRDASAAGPAALASAPRSEDVKFDRPRKLTPRHYREAPHRQRP
jgi:hypothetical protein